MLVSILSLSSFVLLSLLTVSSSLLRSLLCLSTFIPMLQRAFYFVLAELDSIEQSSLWRWTRPLITAQSTIP